MPAEPTTQRSAAEVANAPAEVISEWLRTGELTDLLDGRDPGKSPPLPDPAPDPPANPADLGAHPVAPTGQLEAGDLRRLSADQIVAARKAGRLDKLLGIAYR
jgi:hypothetical protein